MLIEPLKSLHFKWTQHSHIVSAIAISFTNEVKGLQQAQLFLSIARASVAARSPVYANLTPKQVIHHDSALNKKIN